MNEGVNEGVKAFTFHNSRCYKKMIKMKKKQNEKKKK